jgi:hypothetical protein
MTASGTVRIAAISYHAGFKIDDFLRSVTDRLRADHVSLGGTLQENTHSGDGLCSAMTLIDLASHRRVKISQHLGAQSEGCRLDAQGLSEIGALLDRTLDQQIDLLVLNKFGTAEAEGGGLRSAFVRAIDAGIPILTAIRPPYIEAWTQFHGGLAVDLAPDLDRVLAWCGNAVCGLRTAWRTVLSPAS